MTISKIIFSGHLRTEADLKWDALTQGEITEFIIERRQLPLSNGKTKTEPPWQEVASKLAPGTRSYKMRGLDPTRLYAVRIIAVNHRTPGNPSDEKVPEAVPVTRPALALSDSSPVEGSSIWMRCDLENGTEPINYRWEQENKEGTTSILAQGNNNLVNVTWVTRSHAGWHRCIVSNEVNQEQSKRISLNVICKWALYTPTNYGIPLPFAGFVHLSMNLCFLYLLMGTVVYICVFVCVKIREFKCFILCSWARCAYH